MRSRGRVPILLIAVLTALVGVVPAAGAQIGADVIVPDSEFVLIFDAPVPTEAAEQIEALGASVLWFVPESNGILVRLGDADVADLETVDGVQGVMPYARSALGGVSPGVTAIEGLYTVVMDPDADVRSVSRVAGVDVVDGSERVVIVSASDADALADLPGVAAVVPYVIRTTRNEYAGGVIMRSTAAESLGYDGSGQIVAVADTGISTGVASTVHPDIPASRIVAINDWSATDTYVDFGAGPQLCWTAVPDGPGDADTGHGTHVAGSVVSDGGPTGEGRGTAPGASLVFQSLEDFVDFTPYCEGYGYTDWYYLLGIPADVGTLFDQAYTQGARVHNDSWGSDDAGWYSTDSMAADLFVWNHPDMTIVTAAGNAGVDANSDGVTDDGSVGSPATAKNVISVGASENDRSGDYACDMSNPSNPFTGATCVGGNNANLYVYGNFGLPAAPLAGDPTAGNDEQMAAFSSRGPAADGRIKPDVVAPGTWVLSTYSDLYQYGYDGSYSPITGFPQDPGWGVPYNQYYKYNSGTSMASPLVAGSAAVVRQFVEDVSGGDASAALVKAILVNSAVDLLDENNDGANDNDYPIPNMHEGWGRVDVAEAVDGDRIWEDQLDVSTGDTATLDIDTDGTTPLKITVAWSDHPGAVTNPAGPEPTKLVNDLDLVVRAPNGSVYRGNNFSGGWSVVGGTADRLNNLENVYIEDPAAGTWTVEVVGHAVPFGPQPYALVVDGTIPGPSLAVTSPANGADLGGLVTIRGSASNAATVSVSVDGRAVGSVSGPNGTWSFPWNTIGEAEGAHQIRVVATNAAGTSITRTRNVNVDNLATGGTFTDDDGNVHEAMIEAIAADGITRGCSLAGSGESRFCPDDVVTRGQMAAFIVRAFDLPASAGDTFGDDDLSVFEGDIEALAAADVTNGCNPPANDRFCPDDPVTRGQMAAFLVRAAQLAPAGGDRFIDDGSSVFAAEIESLAAAGVTIGCNPPVNDRYCPEEPVQRGQMASFLARVLDLTPLYP